MSIYRVTNEIGYDHEQGMFMLYTDEGFRMLPQHYVSLVETGEDCVVLVCNTKYLEERISVPCVESAVVAEKLSVLLEEF